MRTRVRVTRGWAIGALTLAAACGDVEERRAPESDRGTGAPADSLVELARPAPDSVDVVFTRGEAAAVVRRPLPDGADPLRTALTALLAGPSPEERAAGIESWFSDATARALRTVSVDSAGHAIVDFADIRGMIPNAGSSTGSRLLLVELNGTVFHFPEIQSVEYRIDGSCDAFWDWLQYGCQIVDRRDA